MYAEHSQVGIRTKNPNVLIFIKLYSFFYKAKSELLDFESINIIAFSFSYLLKLCGYKVICNYIIFCFLILCVLIFIKTNHPIILYKNQIYKNSFP